MKRIFIAMFIVSVFVSCAEEQSNTVRIQNFTQEKQTVELSYCKTTETEDLVPGEEWVREIKNCQSFDVKVKAFIRKTDIIRDDSNNVVIVPR